MGQHRPIIETDDPFLLGTGRGKAKNGSVVEKKPKPTSQDDPFLLGVKKKDDGTSDSGTGTETTPQSSSSLESEVGGTEMFPDKKLFDDQPSKPTIFESNVLDRELDRRRELDLTNPALFTPKEKYSLRNLYLNPAQQRFDEKHDANKFIIKNDMGALSKYTQRRVDEINKDIEKEQDEIKAIYRGAYSGEAAPISDEGLEKQKMHQENIAAALLYKATLKNAVAVQAGKKLTPAFVDSPDGFQPRALGREIMKIADPEFDAKLKDAENGATLPGITQAGLEKLGIDLAKDYLFDQPSSPERDAKWKDVLQYESDFDLKNVELTAQHVREKLGAYLYKRGKGGFFGYSENTLQRAVDDPDVGLTPSEHKVAHEYVLPIEEKLVFSTDIPGSGFFRAGKNAVEKSLENTSKTIASGLAAIGLDPRNDAIRAQELLNDEVEGSRFRAPGENPTWKSELTQLRDKAKKPIGLSEQEKARKTELEKYVDLRGAWQVIRDGTGDLTGQVFEIALLTKGLGLGGRALSAISEGGGLLTSGMTSSAFGVALSNETAGIFISSFLQSYDNYRAQALTIMPGAEKAAARNAYALTMAGIEGLSEQIFRDTKVLNAFTKGVAPSAMEITQKLINREITQQAAASEFKNALIKPFAKALGKSVHEESVEEGVVDLADGMAQSIFGGLPFDVVETGKKAITTYFTTALNSGVVGGLAARGHIRQQKSQNAFLKANLISAAANPAPALKAIEDLRINGTITQDEANEKIQLIKTANSILVQMPKSIVVTKEKDGKKVSTLKELDYPEVSSYVIHRLNEGILANKIEKESKKAYPDKVLIADWTNQMQQSEEKRKGIVNETIGVTPDLQDVAKSPEKAAELNILDAQTTPAEDLLGTPFSNIKKQTNGESTSQEVGQETDGKESSSKEEASSEKIGKQDVLTEKGEGETTAPSLSSPDQVNKLLSQEMDKTIKYNNVTVTDVVTGKPLVGKFAPTKPLTARAATDAMKKRFDTLSQLITCITK